MLRRVSCGALDKNLNGIGLSLVQLSPDEVNLCSTWFCLIAISNADFAFCIFRVSSFWLRSTHSNWGFPVGVTQARDVFFNCVEDDSGLTTATEIASAGLLYPKQCKPARASYEQNFRSTWVSDPLTQLFTIGFTMFASCVCTCSTVSDTCHWCVCLQVKQFDRQFCAKKRVKRLLDTGDRTRGPIHAPVNRAGLQPDEHWPLAPITDIFLSSVANCQAILMQG